eukprot:maker-scaffold_10-snap-gene-1.10-mRNA-1 protein AED:0.00 eAED:0.00 QI:22/1/1/1/1/1/2/76/92
MKKKEDEIKAFEEEIELLDVKNKENTSRTEVLNEDTENLEKYSARFVNLLKKSVGEKSQGKNEEKINYLKKEIMNSLTQNKEDDPDDFLPTF